MYTNARHLKAVSEQACSWDYKIPTEESWKKSDFDFDSSEILPYPQRYQSGVDFWSRNSNTNIIKYKEEIMKGIFL